MPVKIRLARRGRKQRPFYHVVIADARSPRDGKFIEQVGSYNPMTKPATIELDVEKTYDWLTKGAQPTETARAILRFKGVLYKKHLQRGVAKGALTQEKADEMLASWIAAKDAKIAARVASVKSELEEFRKMVDGTVKPKVKAAAVDAGEAFREDAADTEEAAPVDEVVEAVEEAAPIADAVEEVVDAVEDAAPVADVVEEVVAAVEEAAPVADVVEEAKSEEE